MFKREKPIFEKNARCEHEEHQATNTRVSEYLRKYGQGKIDTMPTDSRPEINDPRDTDDMLNDEFVDNLGTDELDVMMELDRMKERFQAAEADISATQKQKELFENAVKTINDTNSSANQKREAYAVLEELERKGKIVRAREF